MKVMKFGGTSVGSPERMKNVAKLISGQGCNLVVLSAMSGTTNSLLQISAKLDAGDKAGAKQQADELEKKYESVAKELLSKDESLIKAGEIIASIFGEIREVIDGGSDSLSEKKIVSKGELLSTNLVTLYVNETGVKCVLLPALEFMRTDVNNEPDMAYIEQGIKAQIAMHPEAELFITQGFICRDINGLIHNLERGGSDYTASILGAVLDADVVEIWTDIDGMHNNDPRFVEGTSPVHHLQFEEAAELAYFGAKILHPTCILPAKERGVPVKLLNTMDPEAPGTTIDRDMQGPAIKAVAAKDNITAIKIKSSRMLLAYGFLKKVFEVFEKYKTPIDMITTSEVGVSVTIDNETSLADIERELQQFGDVKIDRDMVIICVVGDLEWRNRGFEAKAIDALAQIPVRMISYGGSNYNISFLIEGKNKVEALQSLSKHLF